MSSGRMTTHRALKILSRVREQVSKEITDTASRGPYAAALASEGYAGGYRDALSDVGSLLNNVWPNQRREYWGLEET